MYRSGNFAHERSRLALRRHLRPLSNPRGSCDPPRPTFSALHLVFWWLPEPRQWHGEIRETSLSKVARPQHFAVHRLPRVNIISNKFDRIKRFEITHGEFDRRNHDRAAVEINYVYIYLVRKLSFKVFTCKRSSFRGNLCEVEGVLGTFEVFTLRFREESGDLGKLHLILHFLHLSSTLCSESHFVFW